MENALSLPSSFYSNPFSSYQLAEICVIQEVQPGERGFRDLGAKEVVTSREREAREKGKKKEKNGLLI